jgi:hypothetical protein
MFQSMLAVQWRWSRWSVLLITITLIATAAWSVGAEQPRFQEPMPSPFAMRLETASGWLHVLVFIAGFLLAMHAWRTDHAGRHVYALSLPIARWRYVLYRYGAGLLFITVITLAFWLSAVVVVSSITIPDGLHAYPIGLSLRLALALFTAYALFFAIWSATPRTGYYTAALIVLLLLVMTIPLRPVFEFREALRWLWNYAGFAHVFSGRWFLIDV